MKDMRLGNRTGRVLSKEHRFFAPLGAVRRGDEWLSREFNDEI
jgi:hypothetical protein